MMWDLMGIEEKKACYESYLGDILYEYGTTKGAMTFEEFNDEWKGKEYCSI